MPTILLKKSDTPGSVPGTANLTNLAGGAEVAVNTADKRMFSMTSASAVVELGTNPSSLTCADGSFVLLKAASASITNLTATSLVLSNLSIASANVTTLTSASATITNLLATTLTISGGTANGVLYLNASKLATSGSALVFDGTNFTVGGSSSYGKLTVYANTNGANDVWVRNDSAGSSSQCGFVLNASGNSWRMGMGSSANNSNALTWNVDPQSANTEFMRLTTSGNLGIGTSSPANKLDVNGNGNFSGTLTATLPSSVGIVVARNSSTTSTEFHIRPNSGKSGWLSFTEDSIADRWVVGVKNGNGGLFFNTGSPGSNTDRMVLDSSGNLGLGVTPSAWTTYIAQQVGNGSIANYSPTQDFRMTSNAYYASGSWKRIAAAYSTQYLLDGSTGSHAWFIAGTSTAGSNISFTQAMTLTAGGNLLLGTTGDYANLMVGASSNFPVLKISRTDASYNTGILSLGDGNSTTNNVGIWRGAANSVGAGGNVLNIGGYDGIVFTASNAALGSQTERARITSGGNFFVGCTATPSATVEGFCATGTSSGNLTSSGSSTSAYNHWVFYNGNGLVGSISTSGSATAYNTSSDRRLKDNILAAEDAGSVIDLIQIVKHDWKVGGHVRYGVIAQDLHAVAPEAVKIGDDNEEVSDPWGVDYSKLVPMLIKEVQSLRKRVAELEAK